MPLPAVFQNFDIANATVQVWLFKKSTRDDGNIHFTGRWIDTDDALDEALKQSIAGKRASILEVNDYTLLAAAQDGIALQIDALETHAGAIIAAAANPVPVRKVNKLKHVQNTKFYVVKLIIGEHVLHAVRKTDGSWQSKKVHNILSVFYENEQLGLNENPGFNISRDVDFFIIDDHVVITNKSAFESVLSYKEAHAQDFEALQGEPIFVALFTTVDPLVDFVGANKLHLRRACAIREKGHYRDADFMARLRQHHVACGLNLIFDANGHIVPTPETCANIIRALLDHRLSSLFSRNNYDVPDATVVT
jgi:hypothetical protein